MRDLPWFRLQHDGLQLGNAQQRGKERRHRTNRVERVNPQLFQFLPWKGELVVA
jgi:hypothetical protein